MKKNLFNIFVFTVLLMVTYSISSEHRRAYYKTVQQLNMLNGQLEHQTYQLSVTQNPEIYRDLLVSQKILLTQINKLKIRYNRLLALLSKTQPSLLSKTQPSHKQLLTMQLKQHQHPRLPYHLIPTKTGSDQRIFKKQLNTYGLNRRHYQHSLTTCQQPISAYEQLEYPAYYRSAKRLRVMGLNQQHVIAFNKLSPKDQRDLIRPVRKNHSLPSVPTGKDLIQQGIYRGKLYFKMP